MSFTTKPLTKATRSSTTRLHLALLLWHPVPAVAKSAAQNSKTPEWAIRRASKKRYYVLTAALAREHMMRDMILDVVSDPETTANLLNEISRHDRTDKEILEKILVHPRSHHSIRVSVLAHPNADADLARKMFTSYKAESEKTNTTSGLDIEDIYFPLANSPSCPSDILDEIARHSVRVDTLEKVGKHSNTTEEAAVIATLRQPAAEIQQNHYAGHQRSHNYYAP